MKLLYLTPHMGAYGWASYQQDVIAEVARQAEVHFYGPGYPGHDPADTWLEVRAKCPWEPDAVVLGHAWLMDGLDNRIPASIQPALDLARCPLPKVLILNKEYSRLEVKLRHAREIGVGLLLSHHHEVARYAEQIGAQPLFWRFAFDPAQFFDRGLPRIHDLAFTGVLINHHVPETQSDVRLRIQRELFHCFRDLRLKKRRRYRDLRLFWSCNPSSPLLARINERLRGPQRLHPAEYITLFSQSRITLNSPSPLELVSPRYYESMACGSLVFCVESPVYAKVFPDGAPIATFAPDLSDFEDKLRGWLGDEPARKKLTDAAMQLAHARHTWRHRVEELLAAMRATFGLRA